MSSIEIELDKDSKELIKRIEEKINSLSTPKHEDYLTIQQACSLLKVSKPTVMSWTSKKNNPLRYSKVGNVIRFLSSEIDIFMNNHKI